MSFGNLFRDEIKVFLQKNEMTTSKIVFIFFLNIVGFGNLLYLLIKPTERTPIIDLIKFNNFLRSKVYYAFLVVFYFFF